MKNSFKTTTALILAIITATSAVIPVFSSAQTSPDVSNPCSAWSLYWSNGTQVQSSDFNYPDLAPSLTTVNAGDYGSTTSTPPTGITLSPISNASSSYVGQTPQWQCSQNAVSTPGFLSSQENASSTPGMESCLAAVQIAQKYAWYTTIGSSTLLEKNIAGLILPKIKNLMFGSLSNLHIDLSTLFGTSTLKSIFGDSQGSLSLSSLFNGSGVQNFLQTQFSKGVNTQVNKIKSAAEDEMKKLAAQAGAKAAGAIESQAEQLLKLSTVPVYDNSVESAVNKNTEATQQVIAEQKNQELIADTRAKCNLLLQDTVETIKRSLLYQFTTETVDWIQGGGIQISSDGKITVNPPQYFQRPLKDLADAGLNAVDNIISQVAPQLCQPFQLAVTLQIPTTNRQSNPFYQQASCTLNQVVSNIQGFYTNFRSGNWLGYQEIWMPQNNYYGASLITQQMAAQANDVAQQNLQSQMSQSNGYKNTYACTEWDEYKEQPSYYCSSGSSNTRLENGICYALNNTFSDPNGMVVPTDAQSTLTSSAFFDQSSGKIYTSSDKSMYYQCASAIVTQPSNIAAGLAQQASQVDTNAIINAQDLTDIGTIIQNAVINKLTKVGISGIRGILQNLPAIQEKWQLLKP
jgi:hypothetical protein